MEVKPFKAFRFDKSVVGDAGKCIAPPYDVIGDEKTRAEYDEARRMGPMGGGFGGKTLVYLEPVAYALGAAEFKLFELVPKPGAVMAVGDEIIGLFGAPIAIDDAPFKAVAARKELTAKIATTMWLSTVAARSSAGIQVRVRPSSAEATSAAATSSWVERGFEAQRKTFAPPAFSVIARFAVSVVTCRQAARLMP